MHRIKGRMIGLGRRGMVSHRLLKFEDEYCGMVWAEIKEEECNKDRRKRMTRNGLSNWKWES